MPPHQRPSGTFPFPAARGAAGTLTPPPLDALKARVLARLQDKLDPAKSRRMPESLLRQSARQQVEAMVDAEHPRLPKADRDRLIDDVIGEAFGLGPLEELFRDPTVLELMVLGPQVVVARREYGWGPTNVRFRDADHLRTVLDRAASQAEAVGDKLPPSVADGRLANGFRAVVMLPPLVLETPATAVFVRVGEAPASLSHTPFPGLVTTPAPAAVGGSNSKAAMQPPGSDSRATTPPPRAADPHMALARHRARITERIIAKLATLGVFDLSKLDSRELQRIIAAYVAEYIEAEKVFLSDTDQSLLVLDILKAMKR